MNSSSQVENKFMHNLRISELRAKAEVKHYKLLFSRQSKSMKNIQKQLKEANKKFTKLESRFHKLRHRLSVLTDQNVKKQNYKKEKELVQFEM